MPKTKRASNKMNVVSLRDFTGGLRTNVAPEYLEDNEVQDCENVLFDEDPGAVVKRGGFQAAHQFSSGYGAVPRQYEYTQADGTTYLIVQFATGRIQYSTDRVIWADLVTGLTPGQMCDFETFRNYLWITNGADEVLIWDGSATNKGIGTIYWEFDTLGDTPRTWGAKGYTIFPLTQAAGQFIPLVPMGKFINLHQERLFIGSIVGDLSGVYFSRPHDDAGSFITPWDGGTTGVDGAWISIDHIDVATDDGTTLNGMKVYQGNMIYIKNSNIYVQSGWGPTRWTINKASSIKGTLYHWSVKIFAGLLIFLGDDGLYSFNGRITTKLSEKINSIVENLQQVLVKLRQWVQTTKADYDAGTKTNVDSDYISGSLTLSDFVQGENQSFNDSITGAVPNWWIQSPPATSSLLVNAVTYRGTYGKSLHGIETAGPLYPQAMLQRDLLTSQYTGTASCYVMIPSATHYYAYCRIQKAGAAPWAEFQFQKTGTNDINIRGSDGLGVTNVGNYNTSQWYKCEFRWTTTKVEFYLDSVKVGEMAWNYGGYTDAYFDRIELEVAASPSSNSEAYFDDCYVLNDRSFDVEFYPGSGDWVSQDKNLGTVDVWGTTLIDQNIPGSTSMLNQIRTAASQVGLAGATWHTLTHGTIPAELIGATVWCNIKSTLTSTSLVATPKVNSLTLQYYAGGMPATEAAAWVKEDRYWLACAESGKTFNNIILVLDSNFAWSKFTNLNIGSFSEFGQDLLGGSSNGDSLWVLNSGKQDLIDDVDGWFIIKDLNFKLPDNLKRLRWLWLNADKVDDYTLTVSYSFDSLSYVDHAKVISQNGNYNKRISITAGAQGKLLRLKFRSWQGQSKPGEQMSVKGVEIYYTTIPLRNL